MAPANYSLCKSAMAIGTAGIQVPIRIHNQDQSANQS